MRGGASKCSVLIGEGWPYRQLIELLSCNFTIGQEISSGKSCESGEDRADQKGPQYDDF
jgi:hypothetical protein